MGHFFSLSGAPKIRLRWHAIFYSAFLSSLFVVVYGWCNDFTSHRTDVGIWAWKLDFMIPFVTFMVIPYMSIDIFFGAAPFICSSQQELRMLAARIAFGILAAVAFYLTFPLKLAVLRMHPDGWIGAIFNAFLAVDKPYNLLPSLHITLRTILADTYARNSAGIWKAAGHMWFSLIGFSTVLTHQHHLVDIAGGFVMATICFYMFQPSGWVSSLTPNPRIGFYYAAGGLIAGWISPLLWNFGFFLLWTGISMGLIAGAYCVWGPAVFRKQNGVIALSARILLAPILLGQKLSLAYYRKQCRTWDKVTDSVWIGRVLTSAEADKAIEEGVTTTLDLTGEFSECPQLRKLAYKNIQVMDLTAPTQRQLDEAVEFMRGQVGRGVVFVHCKIGYSRSAAVIASYLLAEGIDNDVGSALQRIRNVRPSLIVRHEALKAVHEFASRMKKTDPCRRK